jgi:DUF917 family protein
VKTFTVDDVDDFAAGALLLGSGGGGDVDLGAILLRNLLGTVEVRRADELPSSALVVHVGMSGSPDVLAERLISVDDSVRAVRAVEAHLGEAVAAIGAAEIGGLNALIAVAVAHEMGLPLVDADIMGRAYPRLTQTSLAAAGHSPEPVAIVSPAGGTVVLSNCSPVALEALVDACSATMGGLVATADYPVTAGELAMHGVDGSVSACLDIGRRFTGSRMEDLAELCSAVGFFVHHEGRIDQIHPRVQGTPGSITIDATTASDPVRVDFADEFIGITVGGTPVASVPDVILALDHLTRLPLHPEQLRVGQTAVFVSMRSLHAWSPEDLGLVGPASYGLVVEGET